nr:histone-lysine N-methyltransferase family member SUVH9-like [Ipomoea batatas]
MGSFVPFLQLGPFNSIADGDTNNVPMIKLKLDALDEFTQVDLQTSPFLFQTLASLAPMTKRVRVSIPVPAAHKRLTLVRSCKTQTRYDEIL